VGLAQSDGARADADTVVIPRLNNLETRPQEWSSLGTVSPTDREHPMPPPPVSASV